MIKFAQYLKEHALGFMPKDQASWWYNHDTSIDNDEKYTIFDFDHDRIMKAFSGTDKIFIEIDGKWYRCYPSWTGMYDISMEPHAFKKRMETLKGTRVALVSQSHNRGDKKGERVVKNRDLLTRDYYSKKHVYKAPYIDMMLRDKVDKINKGWGQAIYMNTGEKSVSINLSGHVKNAADHDFIASRIVTGYDRLNRQHGMVSITNDYIKIREVSKWLNDIVKLIDEKKPLHEAWVYKGFPGAVHKQFQHLWGEHVHDTKFIYYPAITKSELTQIFKKYDGLQQNIGLVTKLDGKFYITRFKFSGWKEIFIDDWAEFHSVEPRSTIKPMLPINLVSHEVWIAEMEEDGRWKRNRVSRREKEDVDDFKENTNNRHYAYKYAAMFIEDLVNQINKISMQKANMQLYQFMDDTYGHGGGRFFYVTTHRTAVDSIIADRLDHARQDNWIAIQKIMRNSDITNILSIKTVGGTDRVAKRDVDRLAKALITFKKALENV